MRALLLRAIDRLNQIGCGHNDDVLRFGGGRVWLECLQCGRETGGIVTKPVIRAREMRRTGSVGVPVRSSARVSVRSAA